MLMNKKLYSVVMSGALLSCVMLSACGKSVELARNGSGNGVDVPKPGGGGDSSNPDSGNGGDNGGGGGGGGGGTGGGGDSGGGTGGNPGECGNGTNRTRWRWTQPQPSVSKSVDLLFVVDSSLSLTPERRRLAKSISHFLSQLPADADPRIAVMLGHGGNSDWSGMLYSRGSNPRVINPHDYAGNRAEELLIQNLSCPALDFGVGNGEMLMYSLQSSLKDYNFAQIQNEGFYRPDASLAVVFITDENDVCFDPKAHGYTKHPHYKYGAFGLEKFAYDKWCVDKSGALKVSTTSVISSLRSRFPGKRIAMAGIVHSEEKSVPWFGEDAIGHGIIELVQENAATQPSGPMPSLIMNLRSGNFSGTLAQLGSMITSHLSLLTSFILSGDRILKESSIVATVDGRAVSATYDSASRTVNISGANAGGAGSQVEVSACLQ
jgi:hypothetical protein